MPKTVITKILKTAVILTAPIVLGTAACDPLSTIHVTGAADRPIICKHKDQGTFYTFVQVDKDGKKTLDKFELAPWRGEDHPVVVILAARERDFAWIRFYVYCGKFGRPFLVTPRITPDDLVKRNARNYFYRMR